MTDLPHYPTSADDFEAGLDVYVHPSSDLHRTLGLCTATVKRVRPDAAILDILGSEYRVPYSSIVPQAAADLFWFQAVRTHGIEIANRMFATAPRGA